MSGSGRPSRRRLLGVLGVAATRRGQRPRRGRRRREPSDTERRARHAPGRRRGRAALPSGVDRSTYRAAIEAYIWGYPLVVMARTRAALVCAAGVNTFLNQPSLAGPTSRLVVTPNTDTLYSSALLDLRSGPVVLRIPAVARPVLRFQLLDMYTNTIANVGYPDHRPGSGVGRGRPAGWKGRLPAGTRRISSTRPQTCG